MGKYFGTDGFRGEANVTLTANHAYDIGRFLGWYYTKQNKRPARIVIGKDTRRSSYMFEYAIAAGVAASKSEITNAFFSPSTGFNVLSSVILSASSTINFLPFSGKNKQSANVSLSINPLRRFCASVSSSAQLKKGLINVFNALRKFRASSKSNK